MNNRANKRTASPFRLNQPTSAVVFSNRDKDVNFHTRSSLFPGVRCIVSTDYMFDVMGTFSRGERRAGRSSRLRSVPLFTNRGWRDSSTHDFLPGVAIHYFDTIVEVMIEAKNARPTGPEVSVDSCVGSRVWAAFQAFPIKKKNF